MTEKLYDKDPYMGGAAAQVLSCTREGESWKVVLDRTIFYPRGGGQPCEGGTINSVAVTDVFEEENGDITHMTTGPIEPGFAELSIDMERRLDHMRQHLGEHILSAVIERLYGGKISILRIEEEASHIEIDRPLSDDQLLEAQRETNRIIGQNLPVTVHYLSAEEAEVRGVPHNKAAAYSTVRVVEIPGVDFNGCGGTHCHFTGEVGSLLVCGVKEVRGQFRIYFKCSGRADAEHEQRTLTLLALQRAFGAELRPQMEQTALAALERKNHLEELCRYQWEQLVELDMKLYAATAKNIGDKLFVSQIVEDGDAKHVKAVCDALAGGYDCVAMMAVAAGEQLSLIFVRSKSKQPEPNLGTLLRALATAHGGKGGGSAVSAQGMMPDTAESRAALQILWEKVAETL